MRKLKSTCLPDPKDGRILDASARREIAGSLRFPLRALANEVLLAQTLIKLCPFPVRQPSGNLSDTRQVLLALGGK